MKRYRMKPSYKWKRHGWPAELIQKLEAASAVATMPKITLSSDKPAKKSKRPRYIFLCDLSELG